MLSHDKIERNVILMLVLVLITVSIGGLVEIIPLYTIETTIEKVRGVRPYSPLELVGRNIYVREGCYTCHSQMVRPFRDEIERYGPYSLAAESMYDHPFQWGSKRTGPDLARVGGRYSDAWHRDHFEAPRALVPESIMPGYPFFADTPLELDRLGELMQANAAVGVPYTEAMIASAAADARAQVDPDGEGAEGLSERYPGAIVRNFDANPRITELDAIIAYLQVLGTMVDFSTFEADASR
jgi:cytochrome c oxidase cbb3-type subunit 2